MLRCFCLRPEETEMYMFRCMFFVHRLDQLVVNWWEFPRVGNGILLLNMVERTEDVC